MKNKWVRLKNKWKVGAYIVSLGILVVAFQNCKTQGVGGSSTTGTTDPTGAVVDCPSSDWGRPTASNLTLFSNTSTIVTTTTSVLAKSGYDNNSGNANSDPFLKLTIANKNIGATCLKKTVDLKMSVSSINVSGVYWNGLPTGPLNADKLKMSAMLKHSMTDGKLYVEIQSIGVTDNTKPICMTGTADYTVWFENQYNGQKEDDNVTVHDGKSDSKTFRVTFENKCPKELKFDADTDRAYLGGFGEVVSISGNRAAVLNPGYDHTNNFPALNNWGSVRIYNYNSSSQTWSYSATIIPKIGDCPLDDTACYNNRVEKPDRKPTSLVLDGDYLFIGYESLLGSAGSLLSNRTGRVYMYQYNSSGSSWDHIGSIDSDPETRFGASLAVARNFDLDPSPTVQNLSDLLFVGAPQESSVVQGILKASNGAVYIYKINSGVNLTYLNKVSGLRSYEYMGHSIAVSGQRLVVGAPGHSGDPNRTAGVFYICNLADVADVANSIPCDSWKEEVKEDPITSYQYYETPLKNAATSPTVNFNVKVNGYFGHRVAIKDNWVLVSSLGYYKPDPNATTIPDKKHGLVALFNISGLTITGNSVLPLSILKKVQEGGTAGDLFGSALGFGTNSFFVGSNGVLTNRGIVDQYELTESFTRRTRYWALNHTSGDHYGFSLAVSGDKLIVGSKGDTEAGLSQTGSINIFTISSP